MTLPRNPTILLFTGTDMPLYNVTRDSMDNEDSGVTFSGRLHTDAAIRFARTDHAGNVDEYRETLHVRRVSPDPERRSRVVLVTNGPGWTAIEQGTVQR